MNKVKLSIIIPCYNSESYLEKCFANIFLNDLDSYEIICVNDGSTDNTLKILKEYSKKHKNIKILNQKNQGQGAARNYGMTKARGEYIAFVDSDDFIHPKLFSTLYKAAKKNDSDFVYCDYYEYHGENDLKWISNYKTDDSHKNAIMANFAPWGKIYKRTFINDNNFLYLTDTYFEDLGLIPVMNSVAKNPVYIREPLYYYNMTNISSIRRKIFNCKLADGIELANHLYSEFNRLNVLDKYSDEIEYIYWSSLLKGGVFRLADFKEGLKYVPQLRKNVTKYFPNIMCNKYLKKASLYERFLTKLSLTASPQIIYILKKVKRK